MQLVIPESFREKVLRLAHETLMSGHLGIKKAMDRVLTEFFWPGVCGDVSRFCKSCDICQRTVTGEEKIVARPGLEPRASRYY